MTINGFNHYSYSPPAKSAGICEKAETEEKTVPKVADLSTETVSRELERMLAEKEAAGREQDSLGKALLIMMRIIKGDIVPDKDDKFLLENYPEMHMRAWMLRAQKEHPEEHKSVFDDDNDKIFFSGVEFETAGVEPPLQMPDLPASFE